MIVTKDWKDYALLDTGDGSKLERWGDVIISRPDPQVIWPKSNPKMWDEIDANYIRSSKGGGEWEVYTDIPKSWEVSYKDMKFVTRLMGFKHTGLFPEQGVNWNYMQKRISEYRGSNFNVLNLFGYTGGATVACAKAGASVVHVDASKGMVLQCKENAKISGLQDAKIRYIVDDAFKFIEREIRRGNVYQGIVLDPPSYGRGPNGQVWKLESSVFNLIKSCVKLLDKTSDFLVLNSYTTGLQPTVMANILRMNIDLKGAVRADEIGLAQKKSQVVLPCGCTAIWEAKR